jgi:hypothetical protein
MKFLCSTGIVNVLRCTRCEPITEANSIHPMVPALRRSVRQITLRSFSTYYEPIMIIKCLSLTLRARYDKCACSEARLVTPPAMHVKMQHGECHGCWLAETCSHNKTLDHRSICTCCIFLRRSLRFCVVVAILYPCLWTPLRY